MPWEDKDIATIASGAGADAFGNMCGLVVVAAWPMGQEIVDWYEGLRRAVAAAGVAELGGYVYPANALHVTVGTLRSFHHSRDLPREAVEREVAAVWQPILDAARADLRWPAAPFPLRIAAPGAAMHGSGVGVMTYEDPSGGVAAMRACMHDALVAAGGAPVVGGGDRTKGMPPKGTCEGSPPPHIPDIIHSSFLRWPADPFAEAAARDEKVAALKSRVRTVIEEYWARTPAPPCVQVTGATGVCEVVPYMHLRELLGDAAAQEKGVFWRSNSSA